MTVGVRNWPRKPLSERERTIRETLERISDDRHCVFVPAGGGLQLAINDLGTDGGTLCLEPGTYTGNITVPKTVGNVHIEGAGVGVTTLTGSVLIQTSNCVIEHLTISGTDQAYALKLYDSTPGGPSRNEFRHIYFGGTADSSNPPIRNGDGPTGPCVWLDGAIITTFDHCTMAYADGDGLYVNTSDPTGNYSTNVNTFRDCTFNGNGGYGVKIEIGADGVAGMMLHKFEGGNMENNDSGEFYAQSATFIILSGIDFERASGKADAANTITMSGCQPVIIENCNFVSDDAGTTRVGVLFGVAGAVFRYNRVSGSAYSALDTLVFDDSSVNCHAYGNVLWNSRDTNTTTGQQTSPRWVSNRAQMRGYSA